MADVTSTAYRAEEVREALSRADDAFVLARRSLAICRNEDIEESLPTIDGLIDSIIEACRQRKFDVAQNLATSIKLLIRQMAGLQDALHRQQTDAALTQARDTMEDAMDRLRDLARAVEGGELLDLSVQRQDLIRARRELVPPPKGVVVPQWLAFAGFMSMLIVGAFVVRWVLK